MQIPNDWNNTARQTQFGGTPQLPPDGYVCKIIRVQQTMSKERPGKPAKPMLEVAIDIAEGEFKGFFRDRFEYRVKYDPEAKWPGVARCMTQNENGSTNGGFKNFIECVQESNSGWQPAWNESFEEKFRGQLVGVVFKLREYIGNDDKKHQSVEPDFAHFKNVRDIREGNFDQPKQQLIEEQTLSQQQGGYTNYTPQVQQEPWNAPAQAPAGQPPMQQEELPEGFTMINEDDIPF